jgi:hypothetical protein
MASKAAGVAATKSGAWHLDNSHAWPFGHMVDDTFAFALSLLFRQRSNIKRRPPTKKAPNSTTLLDVGAGVGVYGAFFAGCGNSLQWNGIDGSDGVEALSQKGPRGAAVRQANLCDGSSSGVHDWAMSLEVGEHIPQNCLLHFLQVLDHSNKLGVVLSWAHYAQPGIGHISPRAGRDVASVMRFLGYVEDYNASGALQGAASLGWIQSNVRVYRRATHADFDAKLGGVDTRLSLKQEENRMKEMLTMRSIARVPGPCHPRTLKGMCKNTTLSTRCACMHARYAECVDPNAPALWRPDR